MMVQKSTTGETSPGEHRCSPPAITLPKGGGAIRTYGSRRTKMSGVNHSGHIFPPADSLIYLPYGVEVIQKVSETGELEACKIEVFSPAFWPIKKEILSDNQYK
jgi:hypothetical protein